MDIHKIILSLGDLKNLTKEQLGGALHAAVRGDLANDKTIESCPELEPK